MTLLYEGKAKRIFSTNQENELRDEYKDEVTAGNGAKKDTMEGKGRLNNQITERELKKKYLDLLSQHFDTTEKLATEIINLESILELP
uniref:phosphoribosylaminoimidazolesuccinocarboxamide synthase n=1 Tax=Staphylococcus aureus TaxID=1280 RepID=UPI00210C01F3